MTEILKSKGGKRVLVVQRRLTHYRISFYEALRKELIGRGYELNLAHGEPTPAEKSKDDEGCVVWAKKISTWYGLGGRLCWLNISDFVSESDLVVLVPENKILSNLPYQYFCKTRRVALWGHGANLQGKRNSIRERFKRIVARRADWWFGYTEMSIPLIEATGFPLQRITILNNSVDTCELAQQIKSVTPSDLDLLRTKYGLRGTCVGVFVGSLYSEKRISFMLEAAVEINKNIREFEFLIIGNGVDQDLVKSFCKDKSWAHYLGVKKGKDKAEILALADLMINPGLVGLGVLDSFVCQVPMITTDCGLHSPEIAYLEHGVNGVISNNSLGAYVDSVVNLLGDPDLLNSMKAECLKSASAYTVENMARNFADGVEQCLASPVYR